jgi:hypothetical protein
MNSSTRLDLTRITWGIAKTSGAAAFALSLAALASACDDDDGGPAAPDAAVDATSSDAAPDGAITGEWKLASMTNSTGTYTDVDTQVGGVMRRINGTLVLDPATGFGEYASMDVIAGRPDFNSISALAGNYTVSADLGMINVAGDAFVATFTDGPESLVLVLGDTTYSYERLAAEPVETIGATGRATIEAGGPALLNPRVGFVSIVRANGGGLEFLQVPDNVEAGVDVDVDFAGGTSVDFTLSRNEGALGIERIPFGATGFAGLCLIVAYEDRDGDGELTRFTIDACTDAGLDCIRGISPIVLAYRAGDSAELQAAGFGFLRTGWALSVLAQDQRTDGSTLVPLDPTTEPVPIDVTFAADPGSIEFPPLVL